MNGSIFKIFPNLSQIWLKLKKCLEKLYDVAQILAQNWAYWYMNGSLFLVELVFEWVYFQIPQWHVLTKTKLEYPPPLVQTFQHLNCYTSSISLMGREREA